MATKKTIMAIKTVPVDTIVTRLKLKFDAHMKKCGDDWDVDPYEMHAAKCLLDFGVSLDVITGDDAAKWKAEALAALRARGLTRFDFE